MINVTPNNVIKVIIVFYVKGVNLRSFKNSTVCNIYILNILEERSEGAREREGGRKGEAARLKKTNAQKTCL